MPRLARIVCYAVNGSGLGHVTRLSAVARWLRRYGAVLEGRVPEVLFLSSSEATEILLRAGFPSFKLPSKTLVRDAGMDMLEYRRLAKQFVWQMLGLFSPDLFVVDTFPAGSFDELLQVLDGPFHKALVLRRVKPGFAERAVFGAAVRLYDQVIVPHPPAQRDSVVVPPGARRVEFCGDVVHFEADELPSRAVVRDELGVPRGAPLVYLSAGGGGDPSSATQLETALEVLLEHPAQPHVLVGAGPLYRGRRHDSARVRWCERVGVARWLGGCDAAVSAAGYNTFTELMVLGVPSVFYPQPKVADDQRQRIDAALETGACALWPELDDPAPLRAALDRLLGDPAHAAAMGQAARLHVPGNGARRCAETILGGLYPPERIAWARHTLSPRLAAAFEAHGIGEGLAAMASWLPRVFALQPGLDAHPAFASLLERLSPTAAAEVRGALELRTEPEHLERLQSSLAALVERAAERPGGLDAAMRLLQAALKKHPLEQEPDPGHAPQRWLCDIVLHVERLVAPGAALAPETRVQLYKVFPRIVDAPLSDSVALFEESCTRFAAARLEPFDAIQRLRALKYAHKNVTRSLMARFNEEIAP